LETPVDKLKQESEIAAIKTIRDLVPHVPQRELAQLIADAQDSTLTDYAVDHNEELVFLATYDVIARATEQVYLTPQATNYGRIRRYDSRTKAAAA